jgi:hypothetical protein
MSRLSSVVSIRLTRKWEFPGQLWLTWMLLAVGLLRLLMGHFIEGLLLPSFAYILAPTHKGISIDAAKQRYRFYTWLAGVRIGSWEHLPSIERVVLKFYSSLSTISSVSGSGHTSTIQAKDYILLLSVKDSSEGIVIYRYPLDDRDEALFLASRLAKMLAIEFVDYSG